ncbi:MAG: ATP-binding cassette domain-containing protein, partial [Actinomycetota bacterium]
MLTARNLTVEVGARTIVGQASLEIRPGDKVGLVGRNGAGKTTLLKVLGGATRPKSGAVQRADATGYLSQDPRHDAVPDTTVALAHVLSGRGLDDLATAMEKAQIAMAEDASADTINRFTEAMERFEAAGGYEAESEIRKIAAGIGLADDRLDLPLGALSGGERRRLGL